MRLCTMETRLNQLWKPLLTQLMLWKARWNGSCNLAATRDYFLCPLATTPQFFQHFPKLKRKQNRREGYSQEVCNRFSHIHCIGLVPGQNMRQQIDQWQQQDKFTCNSDSNRSLCFSEWCKCHLACDLDSEKQQAGTVNPECWFSKTKQCRIGSKHFCKHLREEHNKCPQNCGIAEACC